MRQKHVASFIQDSFNHRYAYEKKDESSIVLFFVVTLYLKIVITLVYLSFGLVWLICLTTSTPYEL